MFSFVRRLRCFSGGEVSHRQAACSWLARSRALFVEEIGDVDATVFYDGSSVFDESLGSEDDLPEDFSHYIIFDVEGIYNVVVSTLLEFGDVNKSDDQMNIDDYGSVQPSLSSNALLWLDGGFVTDIVDMADGMVFKFEEGFLHYTSSILNIAPLFY
ncbi:cleavage and polyadenylation specificity factor A subunit protein, partial [Striga asiatica]